VEVVSVTRYNVSMPKSTHRPSLHIDLLHPQGEQEEVAVRLTRFLLSTGRFIIIFVEIIVLGAFVSRFKLDSDLQNNKESIDRQIPVIQSLKADEQLIRQTQLQLTTLRDVKQGSFDYVQLLQKISAQTPQTVKLTTISLEKRLGKVVLKITGQSQSQADLSGFVTGLKNNSSFSDVNLTSANLELGSLTFSITGVAQHAEGTKL